MGDGQALPDGLPEGVEQHIDLLGRRTGKRFGDPQDPLLVSVRSGAAVSMPGMMDTILNLGLTDAAVEGLALATGNRRFAFDAYRRLINMFGDVVMGVDHEHFEHAFNLVKTKYKAASDTDVPDSGTGVAFTRNPSTGENKFYGEFLINAQGEDVVAGIRTPKSTDEMSAWNKAVYQQLLKIKDKLERHYRDMQDIEFTIERGKLF